MSMQYTVNQLKIKEEQFHQEKDQKQALEPSKSGHKTTCAALYLYNSLQIELKMVSCQTSIFEAYICMKLGNQNKKEN